MWRYYFKRPNDFKGDELNGEIREKQAKYTLKIINNFLKKYPKFTRKKQTGLPTYFRKRNELDSKLNINKSIKNNLQSLGYVIMKIIQLILFYNQ